MKTSRKILALLLVLALAMSVSAFAENRTYTITIKSTAAGHTYEAYQIFTGDLSGSKLSNIIWGSGVNSGELLTALQNDAAIGQRFTSCTSAADAAAAMSSLTDDSDEAKAFAQVVGQHLSAAATATSTTATGGYAITGLSAGYYLVKDQKDTQSGRDDAYTRFILKVVADTDAAPKSAVPTVSKKVKENVKYTQDGGYGTGYNDVADYSIGDTVPFELIGTLPADYANYSKYAYTFHDTASQGLSVDVDSIAVYVDGSATALDKSAYTVATTGLTANETFTVSFADLKTAVPTLSAGSKIVVKYNATLNAQAVVGLSGNPNEVYLTFSNNSNAGGTGDTGKTTTDKVIVFTYELDTTKADRDHPATKLAGAEFKLYRGTDTKSYAVVADGKLTSWTAEEDKATTLVSDAEGLFKVAGLDDGTYYLLETKAPDGYNKLSEPVTLTIAATTANGQNWNDFDAAKALTAITIKVGTAETVSGDAAKGTVAATIENASGSTLPSTGGVGTKIFTYGGILLMLAAAVALVTRRKISREGK